MSDFFIVLFSYFTAGIILITITYLINKKGK